MLLCSCLQEEEQTDRQASQPAGVHLSSEQANSKLLKASAARLKVAHVASNQLELKNRIGELLQSNDAELGQSTDVDNLAEGIDQLLNSTTIG